METKKYYAEDMPTAMEQIKRELGADAIIVKSRKIKQKTGPLGLFRKTMYEVVVSCDPEPPPMRRREEPKRERPRKEAGTRESADLLPVRSPAAPKSGAAPRSAQAPKSAAAPKGAPPRPPAAPARERRPAETVPPVEPEHFAQLMRLSSADPEEQAEADMLQVLAEAELAPRPAALTPQEKIRAYGGANRKAVRAQAAPAAPAPAPVAAAPAVAAPAPAPAPVAPAPAHAAPVPAPVAAAPAAPTVPVAPAPIAAAAVAAAPVAETVTAPAPAAAPEQPVKRGRGRPRKYQNPEDARAAAAEAAAARRERERAAREEEKDGELVLRLSALERMVREMALRVTSAAPASPQPLQAGQEQRPVLSEGLEGLLDKLADQDVDRETIRELAEKTRERLLDHPEEKEEKALREALKELLGRPRYIRAGRKKPRTIMFVGPTGVGKTTTLVKLASSCVFDRHARVGIINADVFRVGAQDQLSAYARILNVPLATIYETEEIVTAIEELSELDFVFIDTSGKAPQDPEYQAELMRLIELGDIQEIYLTVSSTTASRVCRQIAQEYDKLGDYRLAVTKLDESSALGALANLCHASGRPLSYVTNGQNVPDDIQKADVDKIVDALLR